MKLVALAGFALLALAFDARAEDEPRSYSTQFTHKDETHRSVMFPHEVEGCKLLVQSKHFTRDGFKAFTETEGPDCNCDLMIDGHEDTFRPATGYASRKLLDVCKGPALDGGERRLRIMRESLKEQPRYDRFDYVKAD